MDTEPLTCNACGSLDVTGAWVDESDVYVVACEACGEVDGR